MYYNNIVKQERSSINSRDTDDFPESHHRYTIFERISNLHLVHHNFSWVIKNIQHRVNAWISSCTTHTRYSNRTTGTHATAIVQQVHTSAVQRVRNNFRQGTTVQTAHSKFRLVNQSTQVQSTRQRITDQSQSQCDTELPSCVNDTPRDKHRPASAIHRPASTSCITTIVFRLRPND